MGLVTDPGTLNQPEWAERVHESERETDSLRETTRVGDKGFVRIYA